MDLWTGTVGFLGTGLLGAPMAARLAERGVRVTAWNRTAARARALLPAVDVATTPEEAVRAGEIVIAMLADGPALRSTLLDAVPPAALAGRLVIQMGTIGADACRSVASAVVAAGGRYVEAPVLGSIPQARAGTLLIMAGGATEDVDAARPLLAHLGPVEHIGDLGAAATLKLAFNQLIASLNAGFSASLGLVRRAGLDVEQFMGILRRSAFHAPTFDAKLPRMLSRDFDDPNFPVRLLRKDLDLFVAEAARRGLATAGVDGIRALLGVAMAQGLGDADYAAIYAAIDPPGDDTPDRRTP